MLYLINHSASMKYHNIIDENAKIARVDLQDKGQASQKSVVVLDWSFHRQA